MHYKIQSIESNATYNFYTKTIDLNKKLLHLHLKLADAIKK